MPVLSVPTAYFAASVEDFMTQETETILGSLTRNSGFAVEPSQRDAWLEEIAVLKMALSHIDGTVFLEFDVPRVGSRIDAILIVGPAVFVIEFKVRERQIRTPDVNQVWDYGLDLKNFHRASHLVPILPILVATAATHADPILRQPADDLVFPPMACSADTLRKALELGGAAVTGSAIDAEGWARSPYQPTPTIIEAAQALYARHSVTAITRHESANLVVTSQYVESIIETAQIIGQKVIVFVTGVPGAGKTLVGLNVATKQRGATPTHAVFLSGNDPLVKVLREALARDEVSRLRAKNDRTRKGEVQQRVKSFIQNVHHFRDAGLNHEGPPSDHVVIFDEAQRAWNRDMTKEFMRRKKGRPNFTESEPEFLLSCLDRHTDWAVVICLVGGGQEINRGEAGISAWLDAVSTRFTGWVAYISPNLTDSEYDAGHALRTLGTTATVVTDESLHLSVSMRSFRAEHVSQFVKAVLDLNCVAAGHLLSAFRSRYPIALTRDLNRAKAWIRNQARASERFGLVASSGAQRLKSHAIDVRIPINPVHWFLNDRDDTRSSFYLEDAATEFQVQGLELDWACVAWDADFRFNGADWSCHSFVGNKWQTMRRVDRKNFLRNAYRVLLTRARQGMVIFIPDGDSADQTRQPQYYDSTFDYLKGLGIETI